MFRSIVVQREGLTTFQLAICEKLFTVAKPKEAPKLELSLDNAKATVGTLVTVGRKLGGITCGLLVDAEAIVFDSIGLNRNLVTRVLFYGAIYYVGERVVNRAKTIDREVIGRNVGTTRSKMRKALTWITDKFRPPKTRLGEVYDSEMIAESVREGSREVPMVARPFQIPIGYKQGNEFVKMGWGVRMHDYLVTPEHVIATVLAVTGGEMIWLMSNGRIHSVSVKNAIYPDTDVAMVKCTESEFSVFGLGKISIEHTISELNGETVQIVGLDGKGTTGVLRHTNMFGMVSYDGTTKAGYSGSPYVKGSRVLGIHVCGGKLNRGYSASYLNMLINKMEKIENESPDYIEAVMKRKGRKAFKLSGIQHEEVQIRIDGRYHTFQREDMDRVLGNDWLNAIEFEDQNKRDLYKSLGIVESAQGFRKPASVNPGGSNILNRDTVSVPAQTVNPTTSSQTPTQKSKKEQRAENRAKIMFEKMCAERGIQL